MTRMSRRIGDNGFGPIVPVLNMQPLRPESAKELSQALQEAAAADRSIVLRGAGSKDAMGGPVPAADVDLRLDKLSGVLQYEPRDLTVSVAAGTPWRELAPFWPPRARCWRSIHPARRAPRWAAAWPRIAAARAGVFSALRATW